MKKPDTESKAFLVFTPDFGEDPVIVAAKSRSQAKFYIAYSIHENYYGGDVPMGVCFGYIKSVKRAHEYDSEARAKNEIPSSIAIK